MKQVLSTIVAGLMAISFTAVVFAAEPAKEAAPALPAGHPPVAEKAPAKKAKKAKKVKKAKQAEKKEEAPATTPAAK